MLTVHHANSGPDRKARLSMGRLACCSKRRLQVEPPRALGLELVSELLNHALLLLNQPVPRVPALLSCISPLMEGG